MLKLHVILQVFETAIVSMLKTVIVCKEN